MKVITTGLLNRFWTKGIKPWLDKRIKSYADLMVTTASGYTPDALAVKEGFTELNGKLGDKTLGEITDISSFIGSNNYIVPSDGYIRLIPTSTSAPIALADVKNNTTLIEAHYITSIFARKGITVKISGNGRIGFIPLINK